MEHTRKFIEDLIREVPSLAPLQTEHIKEFDEMLPHVFFGELTRYVLRLYNDSCGSDHTQELTTLQQVLDRLEEGFAYGEEKVKELIAVSFLENLTGEEGREGLRKLLGPTMSEALKQWD